MKKKNSEKSNKPIDVHDRKSTILIISSLSILALLIMLIIFYGNYYYRYEYILSCVHIIGPYCECECIYDVNQNIIISIYKIAVISSYVIMFIGFLFNAIIIFLKNTTKSLKILSILSTIIYSIMIYRFIMLLLAK